MYKLRFIDSRIFDGAMNMAIDELLAGSIANNSGIVYLRFYQWNPATLSFGYNQKIDRLINIDAARNSGLDLVRRMSGGKMVFHNLEYTFSLGLPAEFIETQIGRGKPFLEMFMLAVSPLVESLKRMGVPARFASSRDMHHSSNSLHCYATAAGHSIYADNRKLVGAAGVFRQNCLTVHGSIPVTATHPPEEIFVSKQGVTNDVDMAALHDFCDDEKICELPHIVARTYSELLNLEIIDQSLTREELATAGTLAGARYKDLFWKINSNELL
ncbi:MAG: hypothetical protein ACD_39C01662G0001 [uncultured bacterium]|nr:MAG: hypothetical protein ACD_39C01662G0001 [uncultured bacterium]